MKGKKLFALSFFIGAMVAFTSLAQSYESRFLSHKLGNICESPNPDKIRGSFLIKNITEHTIELRLNPAETPEYQFRFVADQKVLRPGQEANVYFQGAIFADGKYQVLAKTDMMMSDGTPVGTYEVDLYYVVSQRQARASNYEELYLKPDVEDQDLGNYFNPMVDEGNIKRGPEYKDPLPNVQRMIELDPNSIFRIPLDSGSINPCTNDDCKPCPEGKICEEPRSLLNLPAYILEGPEKSKTFNMANVTASGEFSYKGMDNLLHPAFGWRVRAWRNNPGSGWSILAEDWIQFNGHWTLNFESGAGTVRFQYIAANRFFTPMNSSEDTYRWVGPLHDSIALNHNEGSWYADASGGSVRGLGEIYYQGMYMWSKLYWEGEINPLRGSTIKVFFPNTTYDCGDGSGVPWSCASRDGRIWLIPSHASRNGVIQHELAHQINYEFWNNNLPSGSGGSHNLGSCYNPGLALVEGFANFMVFWTQAGRTSDPNAGFDFRVENPSFACASPFNTNESWVAGAFWDLHDQRSDGSDVLWFIHPGATPAIFLTAGVKNGMANFHPLYRSKANSEHRTIIDAIFNQDKIIP